MDYPLNEVKTYQEHVSQVSRKWGAAAREKGSAPIAGWLDCPVVLRYYINPHFYGEATDANWFMWVKEQYFPRQVERILSLGCGEGGLERHAHHLNMAKAYEAVDISSQAIEVARQRASEAGMSSIHYTVSDLNYVSLDEARYDGIFIASALHHVAALERFLFEVNKALIHNGLLVINEYVGPSRFQWPVAHLILINVLLNLLPLRYRRNVMTGRIRLLTWRPSPKRLAKKDPSEAVRSAEIIPLIFEHFRVLRKIDYGGNIFHRLLQNIAGNFREDRTLDRKIVSWIGNVERSLIRRGNCSSDFTVIVAAKR